MITVMVKYIFTWICLVQQNLWENVSFRLKFGTKFGLKWALHKNLEMMMMIIPSCGGTVSKVNAYE